MEKVTVKEWIINKNLTNDESYAVISSGCTGKVEKETDKAVQVKFSTKFGIIKMWTPKSEVSEVKDVVNVQDKVIEIKGVTLIMASGKKYVKMMYPTAKVGDVIEVKTRK